MKYLHQYTNVDALKSILTNKTIRLRPLSTMDDMEEAISADSRGMGDFVFVSSWSEVSEEMIPMWYMYGDRFKGVRIGLPENPFMKYVYTPDQQRAKGLFNVDGNLETYVSIEDIVNAEYCVHPYYREYMLLKIQYTDDQELLHPSLWNENRDQIGFSYGKLGLYKNTYWAFQKEYRYRINIMPFSLYEMNMLMNARNNSLILNKMRAISDGNVTCRFDHYDLHIAPEMMGRMEIITGPLMSEDVKDEVIQLAKSISDQILVVDSSLTGKIREKK